MPNPITIPVQTPTLFSILIEELVRMIETSHGLDQLLLAGVDPSALDSLREIKQRDTMLLADLARQCVLAVVDLDALVPAVRKLGLVRDDRMMLEYFVRHGASRDMLMEFWRLSLAEVKKLRSSLPILESKRRASVGEQRDQIQAQWYRIKKEQPELSQRRKIHQLHSQFEDMSIAEVYAIATEFDDTRRARNSRTQQGVRRAQ